MSVFKGKLGRANAPDDDFEKYLNRPEEVKDNARQLRETALAVHEMMQMPGYKLVVGPFLERNGNPALLFGCLGDDKPGAKFEKMGPVIQAYGRLLALLNNLDRAAVEILRLEAGARADEAREKEAQRKADRELGLP